MRPEDTEVFMHDAVSISVGLDPMAGGYFLGAGMPQLQGHSTAASFPQQSAL